MEKRGLSTAPAGAAPGTPAVSRARSRGETTGDDTEPLGTVATTSGEAVPGAGLALLVLGATSEGSRAPAGGIPALESTGPGAGDALRGG